MRWFLKVFLQFLLIVSIFVFLFWNAAASTDADGKNIFTVLCEQPKRWHFLAAAFFIQIAAVSITFIRWRWLVQTLGLNCSYREAFRLGSLGLMLNLAPLGIVGGDAVKAVLIAQKNPDRKSQAVASVLIDRYLGLLVMFICGTLLICYTGFYARPEIIAKTFTHLVFAFTAAGLLGTGIVFLPFFEKGHVERLIEKIPLCGKFGSKLVQALLLYRRHIGCLIQSCAITFFVHIFFGLSLYWVAVALFPSPPAPDLVNQVMLHNVTNLTSMIPLAAGPYELVLEQLYKLYGMNVGAGLIVSLLFRLVAIFVALTGMIYYYVASGGK
jgi:uncharacterized protein (TIRG00374 family)